ncbi:MAG: tetratricopeptide repeat protein [Phycisphaerales bacterium]
MDNQRDAGPLIDRIDRFLADHPDAADAYTLRGQALIYAGRSEEALKSFGRSLELKPRQAGVQVIAGTTAMGLERYEESLKHYETALSIDPGNGVNAVYLANVQQKIGQDDEAVTTLLTALRRDSSLHGAYALLSDIYAKQNKLAMAIDQIESAIETAPEDNQSAHTAYTVKRAALLRRDNRPAEAIAALEALPPEARLRPEVLRDTATGWAMLGKPAMAAELYERALAVDPSSDTAAAEAARWWIKAGNTDAARRCLQLLQRINPRHESIPILQKVIAGN